MSADQSSSELRKTSALDPVREGGEHWVAERMSSLALLLLGSWLIASLLFLPALDHSTLREWLRTPFGAVPMALFIVIAFMHGLNGLKTAIDDYVHDEGNRFALNTLLLFLAVGGAALALFALGKIAFGSEG
jgi:succinate dehydrogenase / fumarate reductase membrane anchor subunit